MVAAGTLAPRTGQEQEPHIPRLVYLQSGGAGEGMHSPTPIARFFHLSVCHHHSQQLHNENIGPDTYLGLC